MLEYFKQNTMYKKANINIWRIYYALQLFLLSYNKTEKNSKPFFHRFSNCLGNYK